MQDMVRTADEPLTLDRIRATADRYIAPRDRATLRALTEGTTAPPAALSAGELAPCVYVSLDSTRAFDVGFDAKASTAAHRVIGVRSDGAAYAAGLRDGQALIGWSFYNGRAEELATLTIRADSAVQRISYYPRGRGVLVPQLHIRPEYAPRPGVCGLASDVRPP